MPLPELIEALEREARGEAERRLSEAAEAAARLRRERREARERRRASRLAELEAELEQGEHEELSRARREARRSWLEARAAAVERLLGRLLERLGEPAGLERVRRAVPALLEEAFSHVGEGPVVLRCGDELAGAAGPLVAARPQVRLETEPSAPRRLLLESRDGDLLVDATPDVLVRAQRRRLAVEAACGLEELLGLDASGLHRRGPGEEA